MTRIQKTTVYDKVSFHYPEGIGCSSLDDALKHFRAISQWLKANALLSAMGEEVLDLGLDEDFAIDSRMLNARGNKVLSKFYDAWLDTVVYGQTPSMQILENGLKSISK